MAGGWKNWAALETVTEPDFQGFLQDQVVMRFASAAARDAALGGNVVEGMVCYLLDQNALQVYRGSWKPLGTDREGYGTNNAAQSIPNSSWTMVKLQNFGTPANEPGHGTWDSQGRCRVPWTGTYTMNGQMSYAANATGSRLLEIQKSDNGTDWDRGGILGAHIEIPAAGVNSVGLSISGSLVLAAGTYIAMFTHQNSGAALANLVGSAGMAVFLLGAN